MSGDESVEVTFERELKERASEKARLFLSDRGEWVWIPKSQILDEDTDRDTVILTLPEWLAVSKGLV